MVHPDPKLTRQISDSAPPDESFEHLYRYLLDATELLLEKCPERNILGANAMRALCFLEKGADITARDRKGSTALLYSASTGEDEAVKLLLDHGAS